MTKFEFIQEAALRLISVGACEVEVHGQPGQSVEQWVSGMAAAIADEVWKHGPQEEETALKAVEPEVLTKVPDGESVNVVAKEIARLEREQIEAMNEKHRKEAKEYGYVHRRIYHISGLDTRFLAACIRTTTRQREIVTVKDLIDEGRSAVARRVNMGKKTMDLLDKALENLYNIKSW